MPLRSLFVLLTLMCAVTIGRAQEIVISEYTNDVQPDNEWTEFVVVKDDANIVGYFVTDNNGAQAARQGGIRFKDVPLWRHVREGTIIVIRHRSGNTFNGRDADPSDGFLDLGTLDAEFFEFISFSGIANAELNIANEGDFLEVLTADTIHVHGLGHRRPTGPYYDGAGAPKVNHDTTNFGNGRSIGVTGRTLAAYGAGNGKDSTSVGLNVTRGFPNRVDNAKAFAGIASRNHFAWREWREPEWSATPAVTLAAQSASAHTIAWTPLIDTYPSDQTTGVIILRDTTGFAAFDASGIKDGAMLTVGQTLSTALVLAVHPNSAGSTFKDSLNLKCGTTYWYRVYGYRYGPDNILALSQTADTTAHGRQYNEKIWAQSGPVTKALPQKAIISASRVLICPGDTTTLTATSIPGSVQYSWSVDGRAVPVGGTTRIVVREAGTYRVRVTADGGCYTDSDPITITELPAQQLAISPAGTQDLCAGDSVLLSVALDAPTYEWFRDGSVIAGASGKTYVARQAGDYFVRTVTSQGCPGISDVVRVRIRTVTFRIEPASVDFGILGACTASSERTVEIVNTGAEPITPTSSTFPPGFTLVSPPPGSVTVQPGQRLTVVLRFAPANIGLVTGIASIVSIPCNASATVALRGERTQALASLDRARVDFGTYASCPTAVIRPDSTFTLRNRGNVNIRIRLPNVSPPFYLLRPQILGDTVLLPGQALDIQIQYRPLGADLDRGVLQNIGFPFTSASCNDTLRATLVAASYIPSVSMTPTVADVGNVIACGAGTTVDTLVTFTNNGRIAVTLTSITNALVIGLPVTIEPGTSVARRVRMTVPSTPGAFSVTGDVIIQPCSTPMTITMRGTVSPLTTSTSVTTVNLGVVRLCESATTRTTTFTVFVGDSSSTLLDVDDVLLNVPFTTTIARGDVIVGRINVTVTFSPSTVGVFRDTMRITLQPCGVVIAIPIVGEARSVDAALVLADADFGVLSPGGTSDRTVQLRNTGTDTLSITRITTITPPFFLVQSSPGIPGKVPPGGVLDLQLRYVYTAMSRRDTLRLYIDVGGACPARFDTILTGSTIGSSVITGVVVRVADTMVATPGDVIDIPLSLSSTLDMTRANATTMSIYLSYDPTLMAPTSLVSSDSDITGVVTESPAGKAHLELTSSAGPIAPRDPIIFMRSKVYLGQAINTVIKVDSVIMRNIIATGDDGLLTLRGDCALEARQAGRGSGFAARIERIDDDGIELDLTVLTHDEVRIRIVNIQGIVLQVPLQGVMEPGRYGVRLDARALPSGYLIVDVSNGDLRQTLPIVLVR